MSEQKQGVGRLEAIVVDVHDMTRAEKFWSAVTGLTFGPSYEPQFRRATILPATGLSLVLQLQLEPEKKAGKNRMHLDFDVADVEQALKKVETLGGKLVRRVVSKSGAGFVVCADPDGNEFCLCQA